MFKKLARAGMIVSDHVSSFVGTWTFIFVYTASMILWIVLHTLGVLDIDSKDFMKWNLWLSYFAGTQASIVLMSSERAADRDRRKQAINQRIDEQTLKVTRASQRSLAHLSAQITAIEEIVDELIRQREEQS